jgi:hypothetical protein
VRLPIVPPVGARVNIAEPLATYTHVPAAELYHPVVVSDARVNAGAAADPAASFIGPVIELTPVVANEVVIACPKSLKSELTEADKIVVPATKAVSGNVYVPDAFLGTNVAPIKLHPT